MFALLWPLKPPCLFCWHRWENLWLQSVSTPHRLGGLPLAGVTTLRINHALRWSLDERGDFDGLCLDLHRAAQTLGRAWVKTMWREKQIELTWAAGPPSHEGRRRVFAALAPLASNNRFGLQLDSSWELSADLVRELDDSLPQLRLLGVEGSGSGAGFAAFVKAVGTSLRQLRHLSIATSDEGFNVLLEMAVLR